MEEHAKDIPAEGSTVALALGPFEIRTLKLTVA